MYNPILLPELRQMLRDEDRQGISEVLTELHPATIADFTEGLDVEETWRLLAHAPIDRQAEVFEFFPITKKIEMVDGVGRQRMSKLLEEMASDDRVDLLQRLEPDLVEELLPLVAKADRQDMRWLLSFPEDSAGSIMTTEYASLPADITVAEALTQLRHQAPDTETIYYVYVLDSERRLVGFVSLRELILAKPATMIRDLMHRDPVFARVNDDQERVAHELARYNFLAMPVVDERDRLVGIVTHDDVIDVVIQEATEDALRMGAVGALEDNHLEAPFTTVWGKRSAWLSCLFIAELMTFGAMAYFEDAIAAIVALSFFVPLCISTGGNSGSQAATLITRAMALDQVRPADWWKVIRHELVMGIALGVTLGTIAFVQAALTPQSIVGNVDRWLLAVVVSQSVTMICLWGTLVGSVLPLMFRRLGFDPGYASSPFVATLVDVTGIVIYFSIASFYLL
ncbi:MAG: magnesium transporter [Planctomycetes bacterium]|nr:magnesium transporter [Planctomycetota bacterium]